MDTIWPKALEEDEARQWDDAQTKDLADREDRRVALDRLAIADPDKRAPGSLVLCIAFCLLAWAAALGLGYGLWCAADWLIAEVVRWI